MNPKRVPVHLGISAALLAIFSPKRFLRFEERATKPLGIPAASDNDSVNVVSRGFRAALFLVLAAVIFGWLVGLSLSRWFGQPTPLGVNALQIAGAAVLLLATVYLRGPAIGTWEGDTLIERVDRWIYCAGYFLGTAAVVTSVMWS
jgi:hypothetical protein